MATAPKQKYDEVLMGLAQAHGNIESLLNTFFGFLHRNTDFYIEMKPPQQQMGFPPGTAEAMVLKAFHKYPMKIPPPITEPTASIPAPTRTESTKTIEYTAEGKQVPIGNGGVTASYSWTQSLSDLTVFADVPEGTKAKDIVCNITPDRLSLGIKGQSKMLIDGPLYAKIRSDESLWSLEANKTVNISLEKVKETWWQCVIQGDPEIDASKVDSTMRVDEYDESTQAAIRKIMFDRAQQARGLPTSDDITSASILERAKDLPGSPFK